MNWHQLECAAQRVLAETMAGGSWVDALEDLMSAFGTFGGGIARIVPPDMFLTADQRCDGGRPGGGGGESPADHEADTDQPRPRPTGSYVTRWTSTEKRGCATHFIKTS